MCSETERAKRIMKCCKRWRNKWVTKSCRRQAWCIHECNDVFRKIIRRVEGPKMPEQKILQKNNGQARCLCYSINACVQRECVPRECVPREYTHTYMPLLPVFMPLLLVFDKLKPHCWVGDTQCYWRQVWCIYNHANIRVYATGVHIKLKPHRLVEHFIFTA